ncbi:MULTISPECIES: Maf family protein [Tepidibacillus]|uniref:dTTP/UTP pyrophosphatase n=1 Tax=Tepidibacillus decaturensis TaxID=1413211 RepID=A0A135L249_9BACI|nr:MULTISPECIES: Maf family protein [Tepidibacillus]KXG43055.1 septum formation protein Maf [Tepidibacillus decaturensis]GBF09992.1 septum formation protein Maf [Tepidibacillus sp. HK-1]
MEKIILASSSPRRREILELIGISFLVHPSDVDESYNESNSPEDIVKQLATRKAMDIASYYQEGIIIGADTIVVLDGQILGKPKDEEDAFQMLNRLQGRSHQVFSGVAVVDAKTREVKASYQMTKVYMDPLSEEEIRLYIATKEPMDKAGSYGIQGFGAIFIEKIEGDYFNVVGLPVALLSTLLKDFGIQILKDMIHPKSIV